MVDLDKVRDKLGGEDSDDSSSKTKKTKKSKSKGRDSSDEDSEETKEEKLEHFKSSSSTSTSKPKTGSTEDIKRLLFALGNLDLYTRLIKEHNFDGIDKSSRNVKNDVCQDVSGEVTNFMGVFNVPKIASNYGYSWENIVNVATKNQDMTGDSLNTNSGKVKKPDIKELLDCIANIILYVEGTKRHIENKDDKNRRDEIKYIISDAMHKHYEEILSTVGIQKIAEKYGYDWKSDILEGVLTDQDFESKIKQ